jgi:tryptophan-rich sensory protein
MGYSLAKTRLLKQQNLINKVWGMVWLIYVELSCYLLIKKKKKKKKKKKTYVLYFATSICVFHFFFIFFFFFITKAS